MKHKIYSSLAMLLCSVLSLVAVSCSSEDYDGVDGNGIPEASAYDNAFTVTVDQETNIVSVDFDGSKAPGVYPVVILDGATYSAQHHVEKYYRKAGNYDVELKVGNRNGISDGSIIRTVTVNKTRLSGFAGFVYNSEYNMWPAASKDAPTFYYAPKWAQLPNPAVVITDNSYSWTFPAETFERWQSQFSVVTNIQLEAGHSYDGSFILTSTTDIDDALLKIVDTTDDNNFIVNKDKITAKAGEPVVVYFSDMVCESSFLVKFFLDFGVITENTSIVIEDIVIKDHANDDGTVVPAEPTTPEPNWVDANSDDNLWHNATFGEPTFYYAPGWAPIANPALTSDGATWWTLELPNATWERWQCQFAIPTNIPATMDQGYDFKVTIESNADFTAMMKLVQPDEGDEKHDGNYIFAQDINVVNGEATFWVADMHLQQNDAPALNMVFDFGTNPDNTKVTVKEIVLQHHRN